MLSNPISQSYIRHVTVFVTLELEPMTQKFKSLNQETESRVWNGLWTKGNAPHLCVILPLLESVSLWPSSWKTKVHPSDSRNFRIWVHGSPKVSWQISHPIKRMSIRKKGKVRRTKERREKVREREEDSQAYVFDCCMCQASQCPKTDSWSPLLFFSMRPDPL